MCLCVCPSVCLSITSRYCVETTERMELVLGTDASCHLSYAVVAAQRKLNCLGTDAENKARKALRSETPKASRGLGMAGRRKSPSGIRGRAPAKNDLYCFLGVAEGLSLRYLYAIPSHLLPFFHHLKGFEPSLGNPRRSLF